MMYKSTDCTGTPVVVKSPMETCYADGEACDGSAGFLTKSATLGSGIEPAVMMPEQAKMLVKQGPFFKPAGQCAPEFDEKTNNIVAYIKMYCSDVNTVIYERFTGTDSDCSKGFQMMLPMAMPAQDENGKTVMGCVPDTSTGFMTTKKFKAAGCGSGDVCGFDQFALGMCVELPDAVDVGDKKANSQKTNNDLSVGWYEAKDCAGDAIMTQPAPSTGCQDKTDNPGTCNDDSTPSTHETTEAHVKKSDEDKKDEEKKDEEKKDEEKKDDAKKDDAKKDEKTDAPKDNATDTNATVTAATAAPTAVASGTDMVDRPACGVLFVASVISCISTQLM